MRERGAGGEAALASKPSAVPTDTRVVVNAPAYRMDVFQNGKLTQDLPRRHRRIPGVSSAARGDAKGRDHHLQPDVDSAF